MACDGLESLLELLRIATALAVSLAVSLAGCKEISSASQFMSLPRDGAFAESPENAS